MTATMRARLAQRKAEAAQRAARPITGQPDYLLLGLIVVLLVIGLQLVYSASFGLAAAEYGDVAYFLVRQGVWALVGVGFLAAGMQIDYHHWRKWSPLLLLVTLVLLVAVLFPEYGVAQYGATRWLRLGPLPPVQPSEVAKLVLILYVSAWLASRGEGVKYLSSGMLPFVLIVGLVGGLIMRQPDMGTFGIIALTTATLFFVAGASVMQFLLLGVVGSAATVLLVLGAGYRTARWEAFLNPWHDPSGTGFHIIQLLIALGSGGLWGLGLGASRQKFFYVPGAHTDGVFAIWGEETGFLGSLLIFCLFGALIYRGFRIAVKAPDRFGGLLAVGITTWIACQALINVGGMTRSIPLTGIPLPFLSYGGSSLIAVMAGMGILLNVSKQQVEAAASASNIAAPTALGSR